MQSPRQDWTWLGAWHDRHPIYLQFYYGMGLLLALAKDDGEPTMIPTWGYVALRSKDKKTMVQVFTDLSTGLIVYTQVCTRAQSWHSWGPPTEVERVD